MKDKLFTLAIVLVLSVIVTSFIIGADYFYSKEKYEIGRVTSKGWVETEDGYDFYLEIDYNNDIYTRHCDIKTYHKYMPSDNISILLTEGEQTNIVFNLKIIGNEY